MDLWGTATRLFHGVLVRRKALAFFSLLAGTILFGSAAYLLSDEPPRFRTSATVLLEARPDRVPLFQEFSPFRPLPVQLAILRSESIAVGVVESLPKASLQDLLDRAYYVDYGLKLRNLYQYLVGGELEVESPHRRALKELQRARVTFSSDRRDKSGIVRISAEASKPQVAVDIANTYIEVVLARTRSFNIDDARLSREFLEQQVGEIRKTLRESEEALRAFTAGHGGIKVPQQSQTTVTRLSQAENALAEVSANRRMVQARLEGLREKMEHQKIVATAPLVPPPAPAPRTVAPSVQRLRDQLTKLEGALLELRGKFTEEHPRVVQVKDQIAEIQRELIAAVRETTPVTLAPSAVASSDRVNFAEQVLALQSNLHSLSAQEEALKTQVERLRHDLTGLSRSELEYTRLVREIDSNRNLYTVLADKLMAARIREQGEMKVVKVIDPPGVPIPMSSDRRLKFLGAALLLAFVVGTGVPAGVEWLRRPVENEVDVEAATGLPVLAEVPRARAKRPIFVSAGDLDVFDDTKRLGDGFLFSEAFRNLRVAVQLAARQNGIRTLLITSPLAGEGKSTLVVNLGLAFGEAGRRVVLADTDFQRPSLHQALDVRPAGGGLVDVLHANRALEQLLTPIQDQLWLAPRGASVRPDTRGMLATSRLTEMLADLASRADLVLCDSSPVLFIADNLFLASAVDAVILVVRAGTTTRRDLGRAKARLDQVNARVLGVVINGVPPSKLKNQYKRYYAAGTGSSRDDA